MSQKSKTHSFYKILTLTLLSLCLVFFGLISTKNKGEAATDLWGQSCDESNNGFTDYILFQMKEGKPPYTGTGLSKMKSPLIKPERFWCTYMKIGENYEKKNAVDSKLFPSSSLYNATAIGILLDPTGNKNKLYTGVEISMMYRDPKSNDNKEYKYRRILHPLNNEKTLYEISDNNLFFLYNDNAITTSSFKIKVPDVTNLKIKLVDDSADSTWKNTKYYTKEGIYLFYEPYYSGPAAFVDIKHDKFKKKNSLNNLQDEFYHISDFGGAHMSKNISSIKSVGDVYCYSLENSNKQKSKFTKESTPVLDKDFNDNVLNMRIGLYPEDACPDITPGLSSGSATPPGSTTDTGGTGSGNTGSGGYTGPGGVAGTKPGRKIPVPNLNYPLSAAPILPNVRNPGNLPFIHDPELSEMTDMSKYGTIKNETAYQAFGKAIEFAIKTLIKLVGVSSLFGITYGLVHYAIAHGETELQEKGTKMILWSIVGLILSLISHAIVTGLMQFLTGVGTINI